MFKRLLIAFFIWNLFQNIYCISAEGDINIEKMTQTMATSEYPSYTIDTLEQFSMLIDSPDWGKMPKTQKDKMIIAFMKQLKHGVRVAEVGESEVANKYVKLLGNIAGKIKDERTIPILIDGLNGHYKNALIKIGEPAIKPLVDRFGDNTIAGTGSGKWCILEIFARMGINTIKGKNRKNVREVLVTNQSHV